jgi:hypothetical protein
VKKVLWDLFWVGSLTALVGAVFMVLGIGRRVSADTDFGKFSGRVGEVLLVMGFVMGGMATLL